MVKIEDRMGLLLLEDGTLFEGKGYGAKGITGGEICFNTGMTGYQEVFTDPSYKGQVLIMNAAYTGNYGVNVHDNESDSVKIKGLICKNISTRFSRMTANDGLDSFLHANGIVSVYDIDTRLLVKHIRSAGVMNAVIATNGATVAEMEAYMATVPNMAGLDLSAEVSTKEAYTVGDADSKHRVALIDYGVKKSIVAELVKRGGYVKVFPSRVGLDEVLAFNPNGCMLSNGPGDPATMDYALPTIQGLLREKVPVFGICLGHQLLARSFGIATYKMHFGHRGLNHPVKNLKTGLCEVTTQNHGFAIDEVQAGACRDIAITHINMNDGTIEGMECVHYAAFSVQYHPEASPGPNDSKYLFDRFMSEL